MRFVLTTPQALVLDVAEVTEVRAEDASGKFGLRAGHADFLTVLTISVLTWKDASGKEHNVALRHGVLRVSGGDLVSVAAREAVASGELEELETAVLERFRAAEQEESLTRVSTERLHLATMRALHRYLGTRTGEAPMAEPETAAAP